MVVAKFWPKECDTPDYGAVDLLDGYKINYRFGTEKSIKKY